MRFPIPEWGSFLVAVVALMQPWLIVLWRRLRAGTVHVYEKGNIEIGFSGWGPTVGLIGTLRATEHDVFIRHMRLQVMRLKDGATQRFGWRAFRTGSLSLTGTSEMFAEPAGSFLLTTSAPYQYNVFFDTPEFASEYGATMSNVTTQWRAYVRKRVEEVDPKLSDQVAKILENPAATDTLMKEFTKSDVAMDLYRSLNNNFFWHPGEYELTLECEAVRPARRYTRKWRLRLSSEDCESLRFNILAVLDACCDRTVKFNFAYPSYEDTTVANEAIR
jgi:hypothetical protein